MFGWGFKPSEPQEGYRLGYLSSHGCARCGCMPWEVVKELSIRLARPLKQGAFPVKDLRI